MQTDADQEEAARQMTRHNLQALPVVNSEGAPGVITHDDIIDVIEEETTGPAPKEYRVRAHRRQAYWSQRVTDVVRSRFVWLLVLFSPDADRDGAAALQAQLQAVVELTFFIPLLIGAGGNAGSQTVTAVIRALALGRVGAMLGYCVSWCRGAAAAAGGLLAGGRV